jgi:hypothetical protein
LADFKVYAVVFFSFTYTVVSIVFCNEENTHYLSDSVQLTPTIGYAQLYINLAQTSFDDL